MVDRTEVAATPARSPGAEAGPDQPTLDRALTELSSAKDRWARLPIPAKLRYLDEVRQRILDVAEEWVGAAVEAKGIPQGSPLAGEEWISGPYAVLAWIGAVSETLSAIAAGRDPLAGYSVSERANGQPTVRVYPHGIKEQLLLHGFTVDVWMEPDIPAGELSKHLASFYRRADPTGGTSLVLGAGNIASIAPLDVLYKLYADGEVVVLKMNPINDYLGPIFERAFAPLVNDGYLRFVYGGGEVGSYLTSHEKVDSVHITGSDVTHDLIVFGPGEDGAERKARNEPTLHKPITSELGGVSPTIIVPGPWTAADFRYQAEHVLTQKLHNSGHNCIASQLMVLPEAWSGSRQLVDAVRTALHSVADRPAYYRGSDDKRRNALEHYPDAEQISTGRASTVLIEDVDASDPNAYAFCSEFFGPVLATTSLPGTNAAEFLRNAVRFANENLLGTLGANLIVHPTTAAELGDQLDEAIAELRYGTVAVNAWTGVGYLTPRASWGAFPGHTFDDIQSGIGVVHNALLFDRPQKTVVHGPFSPFPRSFLAREFTLSPRPPWFITNRTAERTGRALTKFAGDGSLRHFPAIFASALRG